MKVLRLGLFRLHVLQVCPRNCKYCRRARASNWKVKR